MIGQKHLEKQWRHHGIEQANNHVQNMTFKVDKSLSMTLWFGDF